MTTKQTTREQWLTAAIDQLRPNFKAKKFTVPEKVRVSCGLPSQKAFANTKRAIGEAWSSTASEDKHHEIFISPTINKPNLVLSTLVHELVHVTVGLKAGHKGMFIECARAIGLGGPWTSTKASSELEQTLKKLATKLGTYPHGTLTHMSNGKKKQKSRLIKVGCPHCGYTTRIAMSWIIVAIPTCPNEHCEHHGELFEVEIDPEE